MLKKAGIVVAAATAGLLALSPLAFAHDKGGYDETDKKHHSVSQPVVVNQESTSRSVDCDFEQETDNSIDQEGEGGDSLLGLGGLVTNLATPVNTNLQVQAPIGSCNNLEDLVDVNVEDNFQDNSTTEESVSESIEDSFNEG